ncbi:small cell adhesion glycoprotein [Hyla sarda]|uniref:small cell adhesion glycoprotein n=1 Tax=Hyla sarda TaxID=327740 RepID=UPI0024C2CE60|nr:small cell adhesion glycoprotein [Hyla sarda]XP_056418652.1 small cell adhesion glycoprotein [Hyla sarda]XP_056418653.1 small cell adhesion glycoprotein [Hyla sarda]
MVLLTTMTSVAAQSPPDVKATTSPSSDMDSFDKAIIAGVISAVFLTLLIVLGLIAVYMYKHKGTYRTHETNEEAEAQKSLQMNSDPGEEDKEYFM